MLVAEELDLPLARVHLEQAGHDAMYGNVAMLVSGLPFHPLDVEREPQPLGIRLGEWMVGKIAREMGINATGGSSSMADAWDSLRLAAASARAGLLNAASLQWKLPLAQLRTRDGRVEHGLSGRSAPYGALAAAAAGLAPRAPVQPKPPAQWTVLTRPTPRTDLAAKVNGSARFGLDVRLPGMRFAAMCMAPMLGGLLESLDDSAALQMPGVQKVLRVRAHGGAAEGFAVVASNTWLAQQAAAAVKVQWRAGPQGLPDSRRIEADLMERARQGARDGTTFYQRGDVDAAERAPAVRVLEAGYSAPYLAHATMEPMNCTALWEPGAAGQAASLQVWAPTQVPGFARDVAARATGLPVQQVKVHVTLLGGGFGRRLDVDFVGQAAQVAQACAGVPVQLVWSREEDMTHDFYRPMHAAHLRATLDAKGRVQSLQIASAGDAISPRWLERGAPALAGPVEMPDKTTAEGLFDLPYAIAHQRMTHVATHSGVPVGFWRSVGHSHNAFFSEGFIDELAAESQTDPVELRRQWLQQAPRYLAVLNLVAQKAAWGTALPAGRARGVALHESFGSIVAQVVEVSMVGDTPRVHRVVCAIDCGVAVNPDSVAQQMEGSVVFALSAALWGRIDIRDGVVEQRNFPQYRVLGLADAPVVETHIVASTRAPSGVGEPGVPPLAPALASALFRLTGKRYRQLPLLG